MPELVHSPPVVPVSTIIPCYQNHKTLERAVESVAGQTVRPMEVIIVNDGGGTGYHAIIKELQKKFGERWLLHVSLPKNIGASGARNAGWSEAKGNYVAFLDADDAWHPRKIEIQYNFMAGNPEVTVCGHRHRMEKNDPIWTDYYLPGCFTELKLSRLLFANMFITSSAMVKRDMDVRFSKNQRYMEDFRIWLTVAVRGGRIVILKDELACIFKPIYGSSGLSASLIQMEIGELRTYLSIGFEFPLLLPSMLFFIPYSIGKFFRRCLLVAQNKNNRGKKR